MEKRSKKDIAFDRERAKFRKEIREKDSVISQQASKMASIEKELMDAKEKIRQQEDWIRRLLEYMDMPEDEMRKRLESEKIMDDVCDHLKNINNIFGRFGFF